MLKILRCLVVAALLSGGSRLWAQEGFSFQDKTGEHLDILLGGKIVGRYMYAYDKSTPAKLTLTNKPFLHVFDGEGKSPITNGGDQGGQFPHHRGIYIGWNKISFDGKSYDRWHMTKGEIVHQKFLGQKADKDQAQFTSQTHWYTDTGTVILEEERTMTIRQPKGPGRLLIDGVFKLTAPNGEVKLDGDPEHAGVQFRPANGISGAYYTFPGEKAVPTKDLDYPWVGETFTLNGKKNSVVIFSHPENPKGTRWSAYRDYGRFGAFPVATIKKGESLTLKYRFLVADGEMISAAEIQSYADAFTGAKEPTPTPKTTVHGKK